ncbi:hypothetical protein J8K62_01480 [Streptococcus suis]|uniref:hypothetical protein n=1 Tax=Streptococcus suis TaxID=1307 RepID=UPI0005BDC709|nr:hypothetical protein [Streptococcus suis]AXI64958.1 hypothetical protein DP111_02485 [Streptococcus suis]MBL1156182.1 hypothetical protein [Streptococcus suis]MBL3696108.1 hypothetical protein [Streptococcus suis]MBM6380541.1 hypothetical protein [Streptococcus suis]MBM6388436.1 hypothetical protein [Streptococcus suis]
MESIVGIVVIVVVTVVLVYLLTNMWKIRAVSVGQTDDTTLYFVRFKGVNPPDLANSSVFNQVAKIKCAKGDTYQVTSTVNDVKLRDVIMDEFQLKSSEIVVYYPPRLFFYAS